jgi:ADP-ribose pyrophosphatase YjhB (NUDIX family)
MPIPEFITRLRAGVGTEMLWLPGVSGVVVDDEGRLLLGQRADNLLWAVVSGILEPGEEPAVATAREVAEETGVEVEVVALTSVSTSDVVRYPNGDVAQYLDVCFWCRPIAGEAHVADDESLAVGWFEPDELPLDLAPTSRERIRRTLAYIERTRSNGAGGHRPGQPWYAQP